jgi:hypothetical protein
VKLIEGMKKIKDLQRKAEDIRGKIGLNSAHLSFETPLYGDRQKEQVAEWLQAHSDLLKEILSLRVRIQKTNILTSVTINIGGTNVTKSIAEWIHRRRDLAKFEMDAWAKLTDRGLREGTSKNSQQQEVEVKIVRNFDPRTRDTKMELFRSEPSTIDATLEVTNAITDLAE